MPVRTINVKEGDTIDLFFHDNKELNNNNKGYKQGVVCTVHKGKFVINLCDAKVTVKRQ